MTSPAGPTPVGQDAAAGVPFLRLYTPRLNDVPIAAPGGGITSLTVSNSAGVVVATLAPVFDGLTGYLFTLPGLPAGRYTGVVRWANGFLDPNEVFQVYDFGGAFGSTASYFDLSALRALPNLADTVKYPDARLSAARSWIEGVIERVCDTSFVARTKSATFDSADLRGASSSILLPDPWVLSLSGVTVAGTLTGGFVVSRGGIVRPASPSSRWSGNGYGDVIVSYQAGYCEVVPADLREAALEAARDRVVRVDGASGTPSRALSITNDYGNVNLASASLTRPTGMPDVDAVILGWAQRTRGPGVA